MHTFLKGTAQVLFFIVVSAIMNLLAQTLHLKIPGSILGVFFIFLLLQTKVIRLEWVDLGAKWLLAEMLLFFVPSAAGLIEYKSLMYDSGIRILLVLIGSTILVMVSAGWVAQTIARHKERKAS